ncbi:hypothetical protein GIB67_040875 [Kingdonia uniflora]|uniref:BCNT-C domain-containing protein n=1 Tax=Kingdonia uniflora TaxID=39325 RepID=A0A7J7L832_9MAGN|nr:hypothetical protein GIB67_040875 [Kingdonia uniflora]
MLNSETKTDLHCNAGKAKGDSDTYVQEVPPMLSPQTQLEEAERKARVNAVWEQMNKGVSAKIPASLTKKSNLTMNKITQKTSPNWMMTLGFTPNKAASGENILPQKRGNDTNDEAKKIAAAALLAVKDAAVAAAATTGRGKVEITEVRDFAGENVELKKLVDADSKEAVEKAKAPSGPVSAVDAVLEQIKKKQKLSVLDKTKKDWGEFKENKGLDEELDAYKKSSNQYLDKQSFLQRTDYREFERERDARLALQSKRRTE